MHSFGHQEHFVLIDLMGWIKHKDTFTRFKIKPWNFQLKNKGVLSSVIWKRYPHLITSPYSVGAPALIGVGGGIQEWWKISDVKGAHYLTIKMWSFYLVTQPSGHNMFNGSSKMVLNMFCVKMCWFWSCLEMQDTCPHSSTEKQAQAQRLTHACTKTQESQTHIFSTSHLLLVGPWVMGYPWWSH